MLMANFVNLWVGQIGLRIWVRVVSAPEPVIFASALLMCIVGVGMASGGVFGVFVMLCFAAAGYVLAAFGYSLVIIIIAFFLGPRLEISLAQSVALTNGDLARIIDYPVAIALLLLSMVSVIYLLRRGQANLDSERD
jgi:putative tricarboxylic transport membrane protein